MQLQFPLTSARLVLRPFTTADVAAFAAYRADPVVAQYQGWDTFGLPEAVAFVEQQRTQPLGVPGQWGQIAFALQDTGTLIGDCGLLVHADDARQATIGITLARAYHGHGYATEALTTLLDHLFRHAQLHRVVADTDPRNHGSAALLGRLGMRREGHLVQSVWFKGEWADEYLYATLREEWLARQVR